MILLNENTRCLVQGITGKQGRFHTEQMLKYNTNIVAGVTPGKGGQEICGVPVFDSIEEAKEKTDVNASIIFVPAPFAKDAAFESIEHLDLVIIITEHIPIQDSMEIMAYAKAKGVTVIGPNTPGIISPKVGKLGIMPTHIFEEGNVCTQFFRLVPPEEWDGGVNYHYFQEPEAGRYALDIIENSSMAATDGVGGLVYSIVLYDTYTEERGMENSGYAGMLRGGDGSFYYVFLEFPAGKQYTDGTEEAYRRAADTKSWIAGNIEGRNGYTFEAGKEPENEEGEEK